VAPSTMIDIFEGTEQIQQLVIARRGSRAGVEGASGAVGVQSPRPGPGRRLGEPQPVVPHDPSRYPPVGHGVGQRLPGGLSRGPFCDPGRHQDPGVVIEQIHDPRLSPIRQRPTGGIDLPGVVGSGPAEPSPRRPGTLARLRGHQAPTHQHPLDRRHRRHLSQALTGQVVGDRLGAVVQRQLLAQLHDLVPDPPALPPPASTAAAGTVPPARRHLRHPASPVLVERLAAHPQFPTQRRNVQGQATRDVRQQLRFHRHHPPAHAPRGTGPLVQV
jgi:hypothetical protein